MRKILYILMLFVFVNTVFGFEDDFQNHPSDDISGLWEISGTGSTLSIVNFPTAYTQSKSLRIGGTQQATRVTKSIKAYTNSISYISFVSRKFEEVTCPGDGRILFYNSSNALISDLTLYPHIISSNNNLYEIIISSNSAFLYVDGVSKGNIGSVTQTPYYVEFKSVIDCTTHWTIDDISTSGIVGTNNQYTELDSEIQASYTLYAKYAHQSSNYKIEVINSAYGTLANDSIISTMNGFVKFDIASTLGTSYGLYRLQIIRDNVYMESSHNFLYSDSNELSTLSMDKTYYNKSDSGTATYTIGNYNSNNFYLIRFARQNGVEEYNTVVHNEGTKLFDMNNFIADSYNVYLIKWVEATNTYTTLAFTTLTISDTIVHNNYFYFTDSINSANSKNTFTQGDVFFIKGDNSTYYNTNVIGDDYYFFYTVEHESVTSGNNYVKNTPFTSWQSLEIDADLGQYNYSFYAYDIVNLTTKLLNTKSMMVIPFSQYTTPVPTSPPQPTIIPTTAGQTSLIDIGNMFSEVTFGKLDSNANNEVSETEIQAMGNKILPTLIFIVFIILMIGIFGKKR